MTMWWALAALEKYGCVWIIREYVYEDFDELLLDVAYGMDAGEIEPLYACRGDAKVWLDSELLIAQIEKDVA